MKSKWCKVIKPNNRRIVVESFEMTELIPCFPGYGGPRLMRKEEEEEEEEESVPPHDCSALQAQAFEAGRVAGIEEGKAQCQQHVDQELKRAMTLIEQVQVAKAEMVIQAEADLVDLALAIARKVLHREASIRKDVLTDGIHRILQNLSSSGRICLNVHPDEVAHVQEMQSKFVTRVGDSPTIHVEPDPTVGMGGCTIHTDGLYIDATIDQQLQNLAEALALHKSSHGSDLSTSSS